MRLMTFAFLVITLSYVVINVIYCHRLRFYLICGVQLTKFSLILPHSNKMPRKIFFVSLGVHLRLCYTWCNTTEYTLGEEADRNSRGKVE